MHRYDNLFGEGLFLFSNYVIQMPKDVIEVDSILPALWNETVYLF